MRIDPLEHNFKPPLGLEYSIRIGSALALELLGKPLKWATVRIIAPYKINSIAILSTG
jgi:hypothetical protein